MPACGSPVSKWVWCVPMIQTCWNACPWLFNLWVAILSCCMSSPVMRPVLGLQQVSTCSAWLYFKPSNDACLWLFRKWVVIVACCVSYLLTLPVLGSQVGQWLHCLISFQTHWWYLSLALQVVSGCNALLNLKPADNAYLWLSRDIRLKVSALLHCSSSLLMMPVLILQNVSACSAWQWFQPVDNCFSWLSSLCVAAVPCCVSSLLTTFVLHSSGSEWLQYVIPFSTLLRLLSLALQKVCGCSPLCFKPADNMDSWLTIQWVAVMLWHA